MKMGYFSLSKENSTLKRLRNDLVKFHIILCRNLCYTISISWNWWIKLMDWLRENENNLSDYLTLNDYWTALKSRKKNELLRVMEKMSSQNNWKMFKHYSLVYLWAAEASKKKNSKGLLPWMIILTFKAPINWSAEGSAFYYSMILWGTWYSIANWHVTD